MRSTPTCRANTASNIAASTSSGSSVATGDEARAAMAMAAAAQAAMPAAKMQTRAVPRSRMVARRAMYSSWSRAVMVLGPPADTEGDDSRRARSPHCGTGLGKGRAVRLDRRDFWLIHDHNPLAVYELSATLLPSPPQTQGSGKLK